MHVTDTRTWQMTMDNNKPAVLTVPAKLTVSDVSDIEEWFALILRALRRPTPRCADGFHKSSNAGYGHQRCVRCGFEWEFNAHESPEAVPAVEPDGRNG